MQTFSRYFTRPSLCYKQAILLVTTELRQKCELIESTKDEKGKSNITSMRLAFHLPPSGFSYCLALYDDHLSTQCERKSTIRVPLSCSCRLRSHKRVRVFSTSIEIHKFLSTSLSGGNGNNLPSHSDYFCLAQTCFAPVNSVKLVQDRLTSSTIKQCAKWPS